eukprot:TRINITY_DN5628_c0_g1_i2.p1 TRINITY_DN5628_c0_g1~~TRINITY_DN5628_c0_g1_i2.p1  ORF type:complete len:176 (-),score=38.26 TRINITY_DN5628_c0_g1_i2:20-547(-)
MTEVSLKWPLWLSLWAVVSSLVCLWDAGFVLSRPDSMEGGKLAWIWAPYPAYYNVDRSYADLENVWTITQSYGNIIEIVFCLFAFILSLSSSAETQLNSVLLIIITSTMTLWKTILYWIQEAVADWEYTKNNEFFDLLVYVAIPTVFWFIFPYLAIKWGVGVLRKAVLQNKAKKA